MGCDQKKTCTYNQTEDRLTDINVQLDRQWLEKRGRLECSDFGKKSLYDPLREAFQKSVEICLVGTSGPVSKEGKTEAIGAKILSELVWPQNRQAYRQTGRLADKNMTDPSLEIRKRTNFVSSGNVDRQILML